jgi:hypothetical protein
MKKSILLLAFLLAGIVGASEGDAPAKFKISAKRTDDSVEVRANKDKTLFIIKSPTGISQAVIEREAEKWPDNVTLRLNLKGLESLKASNGAVKLDASLASDDKMRQWKDGKEDTPLDAKSPLWMKIQILSNDGKPAKEIPLRDGYIEVVLPRAFFADNPKSITISWIDFYRN